eukprot:1969737-Pleurochrysis_carterae.AAC.1
MAVSPVGVSVAVSPSKADGSGWKVDGKCVAVLISFSALVTLMRRTELDELQREISRLRSAVRKANAKQREAESLARAAETKAMKSVAEMEADRGVEHRQLKARVLEFEDVQRNLRCLCLPVVMLLTMLRLRAKSSSDC